jgi:hypothetical protein
VPGLRVGGNADRRGQRERQTDPECEGLPTDRGGMIQRFPAVGDKQRKLSLFGSGGQPHWPGMLILKNTLFDIIQCFEAAQICHKREAAQTFERFLAEWLEIDGNFDWRIGLDLWQLVPMSGGRKNHYIPVFYQKPWCGADGRLCQYRRPRQTVRADRKFPTETGFERGLYTLKAHTCEVAEIIEDKLMRRTDNDAAIAHQLLLNDGIDKLDENTRSGWTRFIISLWRRTPEYYTGLGERLAALIAEEHPELRLNEEPKTEEEALGRIGLIERKRAMLLQTMLNSEMIGNHLINMHWSTVRFDSSAGPFLTSDRPVVMSGAMLLPQAHIVVPISPTQCFVAVNTGETLNIFKEMSSAEFIGKMNDRMACQARRFVYGLDDTYMEFVSERLGRMESAQPGDAA